MEPRAGTVALIPFPFSDLSSAKRRPVLLLTAPDAHGDVVVVAITSKGRHSRSVELSDEGMAAGVLVARSWIRTDKVFTLSAALIVKSLGEVTPQIRASVLAGLCEVIGHDGVPPR